MPAHLSKTASAHTPGPWRYGARQDGSMWLSIGDPERGPHYQGDLVASRADADLITAAPDLLAVLRRILDWDDSHQVTLCEAFGLEWVEDIDAARAAIAKAEGRS